MIKLRFDVFDVDDFDNTNDILGHDLIGSTECEFHDILSSPEQTLQKAILSEKGKTQGQIFIKAKEFDSRANKVQLAFAVKDFICKSEIQLKISMFQNSKDLLPIYGSDPVKNLKKQWVEFQMFQLNMSKFNNSNNIRLKIEIEEFN